MFGSGFRTEGAWQGSPGQASAASAALGKEYDYSLHAESVRQRAGHKAKTPWPNLYPRFQRQRHRHVSFQEELP